MKMESYPPYNVTVAKLNPFYAIPSFNDTMNTVPIKLLLPEPRKNAYQFFMDWFCKAWTETGGEVRPNLNLNWNLRLLAAKAKIARQLIPPAPTRPRLLVLCGGYPDSFVWPYSYYTEVVPFIWDCWPRYWPRLIASLKRNKIKTLFCTSSQVIEMVHAEIPSIHAVWIPEGINTVVYPAGKTLKERSVDLLELGRQLSRYHEALVIGNSNEKIIHLFERPGQGLLFPNFSSLVDGLGNSRITICFPRCDTHPKHADNVETLTQRYWECMLSRTIMLGRAPFELVEFLGFNPVIEVDWANPCGQLHKILNNIERYQETVDHYRKIALEKGDWCTRMEKIKTELNRSF